MPPWRDSGRATFSLQIRNRMVRLVDVTGSRLKCAHPDLDAAVGSQRFRNQGW